MWSRRRCYCRYEGEHSRRHLEESRLNVVSRMDQAIRREKEGVRGKEKREGTRSQE